jgi:hypothetical protein
MSDTCKVRETQSERQEPDMPRDASEWFHVAASLSACMIAAGLFQLFGFIGVGLLGLFILSGATRLELQDGDGSGGGLHAGLYPHQFGDDQRFRRSVRAEQKSARHKSLQALRYAQMLGLAFVAVGGAGFLLFDL